MKIEAGKYYRTRDGRKVGPMQHWDRNVDGKHPWHEGSHSNMIWMADGTGYRGDYPEQDLIAEWTDEPEQGTLKELNVKPGDVVEFQWFGGERIEFVINSEGIAENRTRTLKQYPENSTDPSWRIVSRASQPAAPSRTITTHGTWAPSGPMPKTQYVYSLTFDLDTEGHPIWSTAKVTGR